MVLSLEPTSPSKASKAISFSRTARRRLDSPFFFLFDFIIFFLFFFHWLYTISYEVTILENRQDVQDKSESLTE